VEHRRDSDLWRSWDILPKFLVVEEIFFPPLPRRFFGVTGGASAIFSPGFLDFPRRRLPSPLILMQIDVPSILRGSFLQSPNTTTARIPLFPWQLFIFLYRDPPSPFFLFDRRK